MEDEVIIDTKNTLQFPCIPAPVFRSPNNVPYLTHPGVIVLAVPIVNLDALRSFLDGFDPSLNYIRYLDDEVTLPHGTQLCKVAGQLCYMSFGPKRTKNDAASRYFDNMKSSGHWSVLEHANYSFLFYGVSRSLTHELVRHRHFSFSQVSQRYVSGKSLRFVERLEYQVNNDLHQQFLARIERMASEHAIITEELIELQRSGSTVMSAEARTDLRKKVQQTARSVLSNETESPIVVTGNARAWRYFIELRATAHAETEIRSLAIRVLLCLQQLDPILFDDYEIEEISDGTYVAKTNYHKA